ncbi:S8 family serine peptidase [Bacillus sp. V5-8f]|uniref:S8 family serine peptidase n=1 Tax=Bacillus sp. V5-8f TaxID=2053044 RepID=UPI0015E0C5CA|nr:S8 family serine peptidase [Bacillus sp. V5-8f]
MKRFAKKAAMLAVCTGLLLPGIPINQAKAISQTGTTFSGVQKSGIQNANPFGLVEKPGANEQKPTYSEDTILIKYKKPLTPNEHKLAGATVVKLLPSLQYVIVKVKNKKAQEKALTLYSKNSKVVSASPSALYQKLGDVDPKADKQYYHSMLNTGKAQALAGNKKVKVAVIDGGIDRNHPELSKKVISSYNVLNPINPGLSDEHGTHVAGIIAAEKNNGIGGYGVNPNAELLSIDVFGRSYFTNDYTIAQAIYEAMEKGAKVINMSLGSMAASPILEEAVQKAVSKGITIVAAAGNIAMDMPSYPASFEGVISVSSINNQKKLSSYSSFGPTVDIAAPGEEIYSTVYDYEKKSTFTSFSGTSMASPVVAGVASLLLAKHPALTPVQVEYILEKTASDLGSSGYDTKFGNGLVNPVAALSFDIKKIPAFVKEDWTEKEILEKATVVPTSQPVEINQSFTKPFEQHWIKFNVKEGEYIQSVLKSAGEYDHKLMIQFFSEKEKQQIEVNSVRNGGTEGKLMKAPSDGTIAIGVKDVNGNYDSSSEKRDSYSLQVIKQTALPEDTSTIDKMQDVSAVPYSNSEHTFASGDKVDNDFFTFKTNEAKLYHFNLTGVPGVDSSIIVYREDQIVPPQEKGQPQLSEEEKRNLLKEVLESSEAPAEAVSNRGGISDGESLFFKAEPQVKYIVKVSNKPEYQDEIMFFNDFLMFSSGKSEPESAIVPYTITVDSKIVPDDEDVFPQEGKEETEDVTTEEDYYKQLEQMINNYQENARPYPVGEKAEGHLQGQEDFDLFKFTPEKTGIYKFEIPKSNGQGFLLEIAQLTSEKLEDGRTVPVLQSAGANINWSGWGALTESFYTTLKQDETYFMAVNPNVFENDFSFQPYQISSNYVFADQSDQYEENDIFKDQAKPITDGARITGNFAAPNDLDSFYFKAGKSGLYTTLFERGKPDSRLVNQLPSELFAPVYGSIVAIEDVNNNQIYDQADFDSYTIFQNGAESGNTYGSFKAVQGKGYFIVILGSIDGGQYVSLNPYHFTVAAARTVDEDSGSVVKNNKPSKPIALKAVNSSTQRATGYLNAGKSLGDEDWYTFTLKKDTKLRIDLSSGNEADMVLFLYQSGKQLSKVDNYMQGDTETLFKTLKKGTYHIKVRDTNGNATIKPYQLTVSGN